MLVSSEWMTIDYHTEENDRIWNTKMEHLGCIRSFPNLYYDDFFVSLFSLLTRKSYFRYVGFRSALDDQSFASSTICMHDEPCRTMVCSENQPSSASERQTLKIPRYGKNMMDEYDEEFEWS
jgi:hypothetical protein